MAYLLFLIFILVFLVAIYSAFKFYTEGKEQYLLYTFCLLFCCYLTILSTTYQASGSVILVSLVKFSKEILILLAVTLFVLSKKDPFGYGFRLRKVDWLFLIFVGLAFAYMVFPIGQASLGDKIVSFKNIALTGVAYFLGRNSRLTFKPLKSIVQLIIIIGVVAFVFNTVEYNANKHFQSISGYAKFNEDINEIEVKGNYDLAWTFQTSYGKRRFAAFFANPLELAASMLISFSGAFFLMMFSRREANKWLYMLGALSAAGAIYFSFSRSSMVAFLLLLFFISLLLGYYKLIGAGVLGVCLVIIYIIFGASDDLRNFVIDTITFQNPSSYGHLFAWFEGIESMVNSPQGMGLATSGSNVGVKSDLRVGGENQFIIYGVQLGVIGLGIYLSLLYFSIRTSVRAFRLARTKQEALIPFMAASVKFSLLLPSMTSNIETYLYISLLSWWMVGYSIKLYNQINRERTYTNANLI